MLINQVRLFSLQPAQPKNAQSLPRRFWEAWKRVGKRIGDFQARLLLGFFYFVIVTPFALIVRRIDPLSIKPSNSPRWLPREASKEPPAEHAKRQF